MSDFPFRLEPSYRAAADSLQTRLEAAVDREGKIPRAVASLAPLMEGDVALLDADRGERKRQLEEMGAAVTAVPGRSATELSPESSDVIISFWTARVAGPAGWPRELAAAERAARQGGRVLFVEDYAQDDATALYPDDGRAAALVAMSRRDGWFLKHGFKIRVVHCWWTFDSLGDAGEVLGGVFGDRGDRLAAALRRPRISHKVGIYHRALRLPPDGGPGAS